jgi:hypothetical protein
MTGPATSRSVRGVVGVRKGAVRHDAEQASPARRAADRTTVHGFRSSFRTWASERTSVPHAVAEMALAHQVGSAVERSYARSDLFKKRRRLMDQWAAYVTGVSVKVVRLIRGTIEAVLDCGPAERVRPAVDDERRTSSGRAGIGRWPRDQPSASTARPVRGVIGPYNRRWTASTSTSEGSPNPRPYPNKSATVFEPNRLSSSSR